MGLVGAAEEAGLNAATGGVGGTALGLVKRYWKPALVVIAALVIIAALAVHIGNDRHTRKERDGLQAWQTAVLAAVQHGMPPGTKVKPDDTIAAVQWLAGEREACVKALGDQSDALNRSKLEATAAQNSAVEAQKRAAQRDQDREATRAALTDPKRSTGLTAAEWGKL